MKSKSDAYLPGFFEAGVPNPTRTGRLDGVYDQVGDLVPEVPARYLEPGPSRIGLADLAADADGAPQLDDVPVVRKGMQARQQFWSRVEPHQSVSVSLVNNQSLVHGLSRITDTENDERNLRSADDASSLGT